MNLKTAVLDSISKLKEASPDNWDELSPEAVEKIVGSRNKNLAQMLCVLHKGLVTDNWGILNNALLVIQEYPDEVKYDPEEYNRPEYWTVFILDEIIGHLNIELDVDSEVVEFVKTWLQDEGIFFMPKFLGGDKDKYATLRNYEINDETDINPLAVQHSYITILEAKKNLLGFNKKAA